MVPFRRTEKLVVTEQNNETTLYDLETHRAHCLNPLSSFVWKHCDGARTVQDLAQLAHEVLGHPQSVELIELAVEQLSKRDLLEQPIAAPSRMEKVKRRVALKKIAMTVGLPLIMTLRAPEASANHSINHFTFPGSVPIGGSCSSSGDCFSFTSTPCRTVDCVSGTCTEVIVTSGVCVGPSGVGTCDSNGDCIPSSPSS